ncbi:MAG: glycogen/starch/alpha-glucan phosphorylase, partial [Planctomycetes bacterium]|nr:glycogen/starch/alpha-glucan phosphorylase [Planctomycetota bacterium]
DGANIEIVDEVGEENAFMFGLTSEEVVKSKPYYNPQFHYDNEKDIQEVISMISSNFFCQDEPGLFDPIVDYLLKHGDEYMHFADFKGYVQAQEKIQTNYKDEEDWTRKAILNVASSGFFSSDRTIGEYAKDIWQVEPLNFEDTASE